MRIAILPAGTKIKSKECGLATPVAALKESECATKRKQALPEMFGGKLFAYNHSLTDIVVEHDSYVMLSLITGKWWIHSIECHDEEEP